MTGATRRQLDYWSRLGLVHPRSRWGERFFNFSDLVAVETLRRLAAGKSRRDASAGRSTRSNANLAARARPYHLCAFRYAAPRSWFTSPVRGAAPSSRSAGSCS